MVEETKPLKSIISQALMEIQKNQKEFEELLASLSDSINKLEGMYMKDREFLKKMGEVV